MLEVEECTRLLLLDIDSDDVINADNSTANVGDTSSSNRVERQRITVLQNIQISPPRKKIGVITANTVIDSDSDVDDDDDVVTIVISSDCEGDY